MDLKTAVEMVRNAANVTASQYPSDQPMPKPSHLLAHAWIAQVRAEAEVDFGGTRDAKIAKALCVSYSGKDSVDVIVRCSSLLPALYGPALNTRIPLTFTCVQDMLDMAVPFWVHWLQVVKAINEAAKEKSDG